MRRRKRNAHSDEPEYIRKARKRVRARKGFIRHFSVYLVCIAFLFGINMLTDPFEFWFLFPAMSWGVAIGIHYFSVYGLPFTDAGTEEWEQRELAKEIARRAPQREQQLPLLESSSSSSPSVDMDEHLELREVKRMEKRKEKLTGYQDEDFV